MLKHHTNNTELFLHTFFLTVFFLFVSFLNSNGRPDSDLNADRYALTSDADYNFDALAGKAPLLPDFNFSRIISDRNKLVTDNNILFIVLQQNRSVGVELKVRTGKFLAVKPETNSFRYEYYYYSANSDNFPISS